MPKYIIEREIPNAAALSAADLKAISRRSCAALQQLGPSIQWVQSFVTEDKITCVYIAPNADIIREHARLGGFPADRVLEVGDDHRSDDGGVERTCGYGRITTALDSEGTMPGAARSAAPGIVHQCARLADALVQL